MDITQMDGRTLTLLGSGLCTMASVHFTTQLVSQHLFYWKNPAQQRLIIVIVCMAPIYALTSFFGLAEIKGSEVLFTVLESIKECYEALVIACFLSLLYSYVGVSTSRKQIPDGIKGRIIHHSFPVTLFVPKEAKLDQKSLKQLEDWTWQFVIVRPVVSILIVILELLGWYEGAITRICSIILNISVSLAMYSLILIYHVFHNELIPRKPLAKILCIKGVVFFSFWQGVVLQLLASTGVITSDHIWLEINQIEEAYQNLFVCVEMVMFAILQQYAFSASDYSGEIEKVLIDAKEKWEKKTD
jgi:hypothetical protein